MQSLLESISSAYYGIFIGFSAFVENVFPPYPGDTVIVFGGYLLAKGYIRFLELFLAIYLGNILGASLMYYFGEHVLEIIKKVSRGKFLADFDETKLDKTKIWFSRYGIWAVVFSRFSAGIRFFVAIVAGLVRMPFGGFLFAFIVSTTLWNSLLVYGGYILGENWEKMLEILRLYNLVVLAILAVALAIWVFLRYRKKRLS